MPTSATSNHPSRPEDLIGRLNSAHTPYEAKLKALRDLKNQIIGNRTKKLAFLKLGAVPSVVSILSSAAAAQGGGGDNREFYESVLIQSAAVIGSFACGLDAGVKAVLDAGAFPLLLSLISHLNEKVADAGARSLKLIYQSKRAPKYEFLQEKNMEFLLSLLNSKNENVTGLGANIITHSCQTTAEQQALSEAGVIKRLVGLLGGSINQKDASLESLAAMVKENPEVSAKFMGPENGRALNVVIELMKDKHPRTRLLACMCLISIRNTSTSYLQDSGIKNSLVSVLLELLDDPGPVGDEAPFVLSSLITEKEDMQKIAFNANLIEKLCEHLNAGSYQAKRLQGIFLLLGDLCSKLECCRDRVLDLQVLNFVTEALAHDSAEVRTAACNFLKNVSRSVKNLSAGQFMNEAVAVPLVRLLCDSSSSVQIAALGAISNIVVDFMAHKSVLVQCGGVKQLVQLSKSMESAIRVNAVWALRNLTFLVSYRCKEEILLELTSATLISLINDPEPSVQGQALALVRNLVDGTLNSINYVFGEDGAVLHAIARQLRSTSKVEVQIQGMYTLSNVASGNELHKEAVMNQLLPQAGNDAEKTLVKFLQSTDSRLCTATLWALINLTFPGSPGTCRRVTELRNAGIITQLKNMINDHCLDVKLRARMALGQLMIFGSVWTWYTSIKV
ncbi:armadillo repeat-containing protein 8 isoform X1 [Sesamum indicum]|uniref:Armadillo repeat-containing protein 8 isoform X1 n=1 Tax=Sesamum indicum TaxID=4182 RepID=A0A6I9T811_SESIN|nr:armadillo repeat-containing protein 8 isoform X1 [Sesamum indicum]XP_020550443.1 armadillo repeat-containing protein 8 isoform X1 [Sesamum indicum]